ncbi:hypothetical protein EDC31_1664 [Acidomonas methanolica]|nr:hypothetical protein EDC31_1664 [Acidomonas methanolica]
MSCGIGGMRAIIGQHGMDAIGNGCGEGAQEVTSNTTCRFLVQLDKRRVSEFRCPVIHVGGIVINPAP